MWRSVDGWRYFQSLRAKLDLTLKRMPTSRVLGGITGYGPVYPMAMKMSLTWKSSKVPARCTERETADRGPGERGTGFS